MGGAWWALGSDHRWGPSGPRPKHGGRRGSHARRPTVHYARSPGQRTDEELDLIFEELLHIKAVAHLSNSVSPPASTLSLGPPLPGTPEGPTAEPGTTSLPFDLWLGSFHL